MLVALGLVLAVILSTGSGESPPKYVPSGVGVASVITPRPAPPSSGRSEAATRTTFSPAAAASRLAGRLSLEQQVAQLFLVSLDGPSSASVAGLGKLDWAGVVFDASNFSSDSQVSALAADVAVAARADGEVPPLLAAAQDGGPGTAFKDLPPMSQAAIGSTGLPSTARTEAERAGQKLRALGFNMTLAPNLDVDTAGGSLSGRLFSSDPSAVARFGLAALAGYAASRLIAAAGHFPGEGGASADPDEMTATVGGSLAQLRVRDLIPFAAAVPHAPVILMSNAEYVAFDGVTPAGLLGSAVALLRNGFGYQGVVMSDDLDATLEATGEDPGTVAVQALHAGDDLLYISGPPSEHRQAYEAVLAAAGRSSSVRAEVRAALLRDLSLKVNYGLVAKP
jgi:beta-N-acetylhexosaminidase